MQKEERLMAVMGAVGMLAIGVLASLWVLSIGTASANMGFAATPEMVFVANEPEMVIEELAVEAEPEEPEAVAEEQEAVEEATDVAETESIAYEAEEPAAMSSWWDGSSITPGGGVNYGPSGYETYYNLPMDGVVSIMRGLGYDADSYPYWVRNDGAKMLGDYVMVAADLSLRPKGTILESSLGTAIVCDTGDFVYSNPTQLDIAVTW